MQARQLVPSKLKRGSISKKSKLPTPASQRFSWHGFELNALAQSLSTRHVPKHVWQSLCQSLSTGLEDQAIAIIQRQANQDIKILAEDGLHDALRRTLTKQAPDSTEFPFVINPDRHVADLLENLPPDSEKRAVYEFIEHFWGWQINSKEPHIFLAVFGADTTLPSERAEQAAQLARYVAAHLADETQQRQLISELSAEIQGTKVSAALALRSRIEKWIRNNARN